MTSDEGADGGGLRRRGHGLGAGGPTPLTGADAARAGRLVSFILSIDGQAILARHGFAAPPGPGG